MILLEIVLTLVLIRDQGPEPCQDALLRTHGVPLREFEGVFRIPSRVDGLLATILEAPDLRVFGIPDAELKRIEKLQIWAFDESPLPVAEISIAPSASYGRIMTYTGGEDLLRYAVRHYQPLELFLIKQGWLSAVSEAGKQASYRAAKKRLEAHQEKWKDQEILDWKGIFSLLYNLERQRHSIRERLELGAESATDAKTVEFGGYLPPHHQALVIYEEIWRGDGIGYRIFLNHRFEDGAATDQNWTPKDGAFTRALFVPDAAFPTIEERISLEGRFLLSWIEKDLDRLKFVTDPTGSRRKQVLVFEFDFDIPKQIPWVEIDPVTSLVKEAEPKRPPIDHRAIRGGLDPKK